MGLHRPEPIYSYSRLHLGEVGLGGGPAGDLFIEIVERQHSVFHRRGHNLHCTITVPMTAMVSAEACVASAAQNMAASERRRSMMKKLPCCQLPVAIGIQLLPKSVPPKKSAWSSTWDRNIHLPMASSD